jgi:CRP-like cAMP-binding protein
MCTLTERLKILGRVPFLQDLTPADLEWVNSLFHQEDFQADEVICRSGERAERFFVIADGRVKLLRHSLTGREILLDLLTPGEFFGAFSGQSNEDYAETAVAQTASCILVVSRETFQQILRRFPAVALQVIDITSRRLQAANLRVHQLSTLPVEGRIASILLALGEKFGEEQPVGLLLQVPLTREDLAGMAGTTTESASRVMSQLQKEGLVHAGRGWVALTDRTGLQAVAGKELE